MAINPEKVLAATLPDASHAWEPDDVILYHLGVGAGTSPADERELKYVYERDLEVLPTFGVLPMFKALRALRDLDGLDVDFGRMLHGRHELELHQTVPARASVTTSARITQIADKGQAAVAVVELVSRDETGDALFTNRMTAFFRDAGGFGGSRTLDQPAVIPIPDRQADHEAEVPTLPQQALLYRLSGDRHPVHVDPAVAQRGGFDRPILHGLCTYAVACRTVVEELLGGDLSRIASYRVRFAGVLFPGETLVVRMWQTPGAVVLEASCKERGTPVIDQAAITLR